MADAPLFEVDALEKYFRRDTNILDTLLRRRSGSIQAVDGVSLTLDEDDVQGIIGESGCGKTTLLMTLMGLHQPTGGEIRFDGENTSQFDKADWKRFRRRVQIIFQDPFNSLNPKMTVRELLREPLEIHGLADEHDRIRTALAEAELIPQEKYLNKIPAQLSGGEKQRVSIARALILEPEVLLADEPVSMLDVSTQASILKLLRKLRDRKGLSLFYISHDISTVAYVCDRLHVMYMGRIVETAPTLELIEDPKHPYSQALIQAVPIARPGLTRSRTELEGTPQDPIDLGEGCRFRDRCPERMDICEITPEFVDIEPDRQTACHLHYDHEVGQQGASNPAESIKGGGA
jgi:peptide/nickel transport system ATP-binding protein